MTKNLKEGNMISFRRYGDPFPRLGKTIILGFNSVVIETVEKIQLFIPAKMICKIF